MPEIKFYVLDSESNGLSSSIHELTEICAIRVDDRVSLAKNIKLDKPQNSSEQALAVTGKTIAEIQRLGEPKGHVINCFNEFFQADGVTPAYRCVVAHNASFDRKFLHALWQQHGLKFPVDLWVDTVPMSRVIQKKAGIVKPAANLQATADYLGIKKVSGKHNAISDARNLYFIWLKLKEELDFLEYMKSIPHSIEEEVACE